MTVTAVRSAAGVALASAPFRLRDRFRHRRMGFRADTPPQIARIAPPRLAGEPRPLRAYLAERYRYWLAGEWLERAFPRRVRLNHEAVAGNAWIRPGDLLSYHHARAEEPVRPAPPVVLHEDEWLLYLHGAVLGFLAGLIHLAVFG